MLAQHKKAFFKNVTGLGDILHKRDIRNVLNPMLDF